MSRQDEDDRTRGADTPALEDDREQVVRLLRVVRDTTARLESLGTRARRALEALEAVRTNRLEPAHAEALADFSLWKRDASDIRLDIAQALEQISPIQGSAALEEVDARELERLRDAVEHAKQTLRRLIDHVKQQAGDAYRDLLN